MEPTTNPDDATSATDATPETATDLDKAATPNAWLDRMAMCRTRRDSLVETWKESVAYRAMQPFGLTADTVDGSITKLTSDRRIVLAEDWSRTKQKTAQLCFQVPRVAVEPLNPIAEPGAPIFAVKLNHMLGDNGVKAAFMMDECLADVINAAGIAVSVVGYETASETVKVPAFDQNALLQQGSTPEMIQAAVDAGQLPMKDQINLIYSGYYMNHISANELLWPTEFKYSDWDRAPWLGYDTWMPTATVVATWGPAGSDKLPENFKGSGGRPVTLADDLLPAEAKNAVTADYTKVSVIWYKASLFRPEVRHPECFHRVTFVDGVPDPVEDIPSPWQKWVPATPEVPAGVDPMSGQPTPGQPATDGHYIGVTTFPIRVETLVYVSDMAVPPSDSEAGRPAVRELMRFHEQNLKQRDNSIPIRWADVNRIDEEVMEQIKNGDWQGIVPMNGPGDRALGEISRANYPRENFEFQKMESANLDRSWSMGNNALSLMSPGRRSAAEANNVQGNSDLRTEYEKSRIERFLLGNVRVLADLMQMFETKTSYVKLVGPDMAERLTPFSNANIPGKYAFDLVPDSSEHIDVETRINRVLKLYNIAANSTSINRPYLEKEAVQLMGFDPAKAVLPPPEPKPDPSSVSFRFSGEDIATNPIAVAVMLQSGYKLTPEMIKAAQLMILSAHVPAPDHVGVDGSGGAPPPAEKVTPPDANEPILKRSESGERLMSGV